MTTTAGAPNALLVNVPSPLIDESGSSWLSRFAISQGADLATAMAFLGIPTIGDVDVLMVGDFLKTVRRKCGLPDDALAWHDRVMSRLKQLASIDVPLLATDHLKRPLVQVCRHCLHEMRTPYFPIHWRFAVWQWCPLHDCLMVATCRHCGKRPHALIDIANTRAGRKGIAYLNRCMNCGELLTPPAGTPVASRRFVELRPEQQRQLANGRALLSALYYGWFRVRGQSLKMPTSAMAELMTMDDFPPPIRPEQSIPRQRRAPGWLLT